MGPRAPSRAQRGFTLLEILIVMGLMGVFVAIVLPDFSKFIPEMKVDKAATKLATDLRMAQQQAVGDMSYVWIYFEAANERYYSATSSRYMPNPFAEDGTIKDPLSLGSALEVDYTSDDTFAGVQITAATSGFVLFNPYGALAFPWGSVTVTIGHAATTYTRQVQVTYPIGKVTLLP